MKELILRKLPKQLTASGCEKAEPTNIGVDIAEFCGGKTV